MSTIDNYEYDCTKKCKCRDHGHKITAAITKRSVADDKLAAYVAKTCRNFPEVLDYEGRSALHLAASVDRYALVEWLLNHGAIINNKDEESGNSALHRALFYGCIDCAVLLLRYGANFDLTDNDFRNPLQYISKPSELNYDHEIPQSNEILVWGTNKNYNLGIGNDQGTTSPQSVDEFRKQDISIKTLSMSIYHSLFVDHNGNVYAVGHGKGGRLGTGSENSLPVPKCLKLPTRDPEERAISVSCSKQHSLILTNKGSVYSCGLNAEHQLGIRQASDKLINLKEVVSLKQSGVENLVGVIAKDFHSVAFNNEEIYVWGTNKGQFGMKKDISHVPLPRLLPLPEKKKIKIVESNNSAIACYSSCKLVFLYHNFKMKTMKTPSLEPLVCISLTGGVVKKEEKQESNSVLKLLVLTETNCVYVWYEDSLQYVRCMYPQTRHLAVDKILMRANHLMILSEGDLYMGKASKIAIRNSFDISEYQDTYNKKEICSKSLIKIDLKRVSNVDRAIDVFCNDDFESFAVLQESSKKYYEIPKILPEENTFKSLLHDVSEDDGVHDITFHVDNEIFPAHRFIVFSRSKGLMKAIENINDKIVHLKYQGLTGKMFEIILKHIYTNYFLVDDDLIEIQHSLGPEFSGERADVCNIFLKFAVKFELNDLVTSVKSLFDGKTLRPKSKFPKLRRTAFSNLHDVKIICAGDQELNVHKCVLVARLEYFNLMFNNSWSETKAVNLTTVPLEYMTSLIDFLYTKDAEAFRKEKHSESFLYNMIVLCDQFFVNRLRQVCENLVLERISIRKCGDMLDFACAYNCELLEKGCLNFISQNLSRILEQRSLEGCEPNALMHISAFYRQAYKYKFDFRVITPNSDAVPDDALGDFVSDFNVDLDFKMSDSDPKSKIKSKLKFNKLAISKRNYEKEPIAFMKDLSFSLATPQESVTKKCDISSEAEDISVKMLSQAKTWMKVQVNKKDSKKKIVLAGIKSNEILKDEIKPKEQYINLNLLTKTPDMSQAGLIDEEPSSANRPNFILGDFTPLKGEKLSQKQRKRLTSESKADNSPVVKTSPISIPQKTNAWGVVQTPSSYEQSSFADIMKSPDSFPQFQVSSPDVTKTPQTKSSFMGSPSPNSSRNKFSIPTSSPSPSRTIDSARGGVNSSFSKILRDEREQKEYFDKMKSKSLVLTQIEETAIDELEAFYNVANVFDEWIRVDRKQREQTMNFSVWQHC